MPYATIDDVFRRYRPIRSIVGSSDTSVDSVDISSIYIADQEALIDGYLSRRYITPLAEPVGPLITRIASDLSVFNLLVEKLPEVPDFMQPRYDRSINDLEMLRDGKMDLTSQTVLTDAGDEEAWSSTQDFHPVVSPVLDPIDQAVDVDQVNADRDARLSDA